MRFLQTILRSYKDSRAEEFGFSLEEFRALVPDNPGAVHLGEFVLARACARGNELAWEHFVREYRPFIYRIAAAIARDDVAGRELADSLYADLFSGRKLASYSGRGSFEGWLRTVLAQEYVNGLRAGRRLSPFDEAIGVLQGPAVPNGDASLLASCTDAVLAQLEPEERVLLSAYYLDGRALHEIGCMLAVHESTVSRRLSKLTQTLRKRIVNRLRNAGIPKQEAERLLGSDVRELTIDVRSRLAEGRQV